jgi:hypothetical protein
MSKAIPFDTIVEAVFEGAQKGIKKYHRMSGGYDVKYMPESYIQGKIADMLHEYGLPYVTLETKMSDLAEFGGGGLDRRTCQNDGKRVDVVAWWEKDEPRTLIEVKRYSDSFTCCEDEKRVVSLIKKIDSCKEGILVLCTSSEVEDKVYNDIDSVGSELVEGWKTDRFVVKKYRGEDWYYGVACFTIKQKDL